ncbi:C2H2-type zinc finger protein [Halomicroarcula limicola]|uniref:C2H2-type zinc finger protein n=1 Tax=Haloarcula limicola TaxID=1429915 RepID=A0A8J8C8F2_9EURY|nr:DUF2256 domain-containing protein [Halomicroarcula limicola]MBV0924520.1 C2H2-type zinc finger protein [Halomicroarcula limicola]
MNSERLDHDRDYEYDAPADAPTYDCPYCGRPFAREEWRTLHYGLEHPAELDDEEVQAFRETYEDEEEDLGTFRLQALAVLVAIYFCLLMIYALV